MMDNREELYFDLCIVSEIAESNSGANIHFTDSGHIPLERIRRDFEYGLRLAIRSRDRQSPILIVRNKKEVLQSICRAQRAIPTSLSFDSETETWKVRFQELDGTYYIKSGYPSHVNSLDAVRRALTHRNAVWFGCHEKTEISCVQDCDDPVFDLKPLDPKREK